MALTLKLLKIKLAHQLSTKKIVKDGNFSYNFKILDLGLLKITLVNHFNKKSYQIPNYQD